MIIFVSNEIENNQIEKPSTGSQKQKVDNFLLLNMTEILKTNRKSHFPPFYDDFSHRNFTLKIENFIVQYFEDQNYANEMD